jgi:hypothetical protein
MNKKILFFLALISLGWSTSYASWWNDDWDYRKQINLTSNDSIYNWNDSVEFNLTGLTLDTNNCADELRFINDTDNSTIEFQVLNATGENETVGSQWCVVRLEDVFVQKSGVVSDIYAYYGNAGATNPGYSQIDNVIQGTNLLLNGDFETGNLTGWGERADRYNDEYVNFVIDSVTVNSGSYAVIGNVTDTYPGSDSLYQCVNFSPQYEYNISVAVFTDRADHVSQENVAMAFFDLQNSTASKDYDDVFASFGIGDANWQNGGIGIIYGYGSYDNWVIGRVNTTSETHAYNSSYQTFYIEAEQNGVWNWTQWNLSDVVTNNLTMSFSKTLNDVTHICAGYKIADGDNADYVSGYVDDFAIIPMGDEPVTSFGGEEENIVNVSVCQNIVVSGEYHLIQNVTGDTDGCFNIVGTDNVLLDCQNYTISYNHNQTSAIYSDGNDNITIKDCGINFTADNQSSAIYLKNGNNVEIKNSNIVSVGYGNSIQFENINNSHVHDNFVNTTGADSDCFITYSSGAGNTVYNIIIENNEFYTYGQYSSCVWVERANNVKIDDNVCETINGWGFHVWGTNDSYVINNNITSNSRAVYVYWDDTGIKTKNTTVKNNWVYSTLSGGEASGSGIMAQFVDEVNVINNTVICEGSDDSSNLCRAIYYVEVENGNISYNDVTSTGDYQAHGIYFLQYNNDGRKNAGNWVGYNVVNTTGGNSSHIIGISYDQSYGIRESNVFVSNVLLNGQTGGYAQFDLTGNFNGTQIIDMTVGEYFFGHETFGRAYLTFENTNYGKINYTGGVIADGIGRNLYEDMVFADNYVFVDSDTGLNEPANITLYNIGNRGFYNPVILKDGDVCYDCVNYTNLNAENVTFSVTGFSSYEIGSGYPEYIPGVSMTELGRDASGFLTGIGRGFPVFIIALAIVIFVGGLFVTLKGGFGR